ncbi:MAG: acetyl-CoA C-acyltransferase, partial [Nitrospirae bacterium]
MRPHYGTDGREYCERSFAGHHPAGSGRVFHSIAQARGTSVEDKAKSLGLPILGYVKDYADFGYEPACMGLAPVGAIAKVLAKARLTLKDFAVWEINEAFASVVLGINRILDSSSLMQRKFGHYGLTERLGEIPPDDLNPHGGAIALGHPVGVSGLRLAMTSLFELKRRNAERAL